MDSIRAKTARDIGRVAAVSAAICVPLILITPVVGDERFHFPLAVRFASGFPVFAPDYSSAYTPLPYIMIGAVLRLTGAVVEVARLVNFAVGILGVWGIYRLVQLLRPGAARWAMVFLAFAPYYLRDCSVLYMGNWVVAATLWALVFFVRRAGRWDMVRAGALFGVATLCGQWALMVVAAAIAAEVGGAFSPAWRTTRSALAVALSRAGVLLVFQAPAVWVFAGWGALAPPGFSQAHAVTLAPGHAVGVLAVLGFTFVWWGLRRIGRIPPLSLVALGALLPLIALALPEVSQDQGLETFTGLAARLLQTAGSVVGTDSPWLLVPAAFLGLVVIRLTLQADTVPAGALGLSVVFLTVAFSASSIVGESHIRMLPPLLFAAVVAADRVDVTLRAVVAQSALLGVAYALYHGLVKFG